MKLLKIIKREAVYLKASDGKYRGSPIIIELQPGDVVQFRIKGTQQRCEVSLGHCYNLAKTLALQQRNKEANRIYTVKKKAGIKARKPKAVFVPFNPKLYNHTR